MIAAVGWQRRARLTPSRSRPADPGPRTQPGTTHSGTTHLGTAHLGTAQIDVAAEVRAVLGRFDSRASRQFANFDTAMQPGLTARADPATFRQVLAELIGAAVRRAPCGQVLVVAGRQGDRVQISVSDDGMVLGRNATESALREVAALTALQGGTLDIDVRPGEGTTILMRLPDRTATHPVDLVIAVPANSVATAPC